MKRAPKVRQNLYIDREIGDALEAMAILAVQMFVCVIEFKLVSLAGFILIPFALWNRTSFLAERVLGHVVSSGIKVMVLG